MAAERNAARRAGTGAAAGTGDALDGVRQSFNARLIQDHERFVALRAALRARQVPPEAIIAELRNRAHKVRGGAAIFEMRELAATACALEEAAIAASVQVRQGEAMVEAPLASLINFLALTIAANG
ncbi:MAG TPA: Hpt domain-containing protein [Steroidobacteraceae bacterium]|nr:Hpt domain-containing protein [Steroidobacteraceae bacterium]